MKSNINPDQKLPAKVSVIVPVYNVEVFLRRCVDSILLQTYPNLEVVLIDDGSSDKSGMICDEYAAKDMRIRVVHQENAGVSAARNMGIEASSGEYITFCDSDDALAPGFIDAAMNDCLQFSLDLWMGTSVRIVDGKETGRNEPWDRLLANTNELTDIQMLSIHYAATCISAKIWRRKLIGNTRFIASMNYGEDALFTHTLLKTPARMLASPQVVYYYYPIASGLTGSISEKKCRSMVQWTLFILEDANQRQYPVNGRYVTCLHDDWCSNLYYTQMQILRSDLPRSEKNKLLDILLENWQLYNIARKNGFLNVHPRLHRVCNYILDIIKILRKRLLSASDSHSE